MSRYPHPPGDPQAVAAGCLCPVLDNGHGRGCGYVDSQGAPLYVFNDACPLHGGNQAEVMDPNEVCFDANDYDAAGAALRAGQA